MSSGLDPYQDGHSVGPDLGPNCLQRETADDKRQHSKERVKLSGKKTNGSSMKQVYSYAFFAIQALLAVPRG